MQENKHNSLLPKRDTLFWVAILSILVFTIMGIGTDTDQYAQRQDLNIPDWYFYLIFIVDIISLLAIFLMYLMKKIGIYLFPFSILVHFIGHLYYLSTMLYTDVTSLFLFISVGLLYFIPVWEKLK